MPSALEVQNLRKVYKGGFEALKGISFTVEQGDFMALLGPNGAGKSTTIGIISSLVNKTSGNVSIFGCDIDRDFAAAKMHIGIVPQEFNFNQFEKVEDILKSQAGYFGLDKKTAAQQSEKYLKLLGLWDKKAERARMLSGGMKRRLMIARALVHEPKLLILDEPTAGVDIELRRSMWSFLTELNKKGTTIILTTHYLEEAESLCDRIAIIHKGAVAACEPTATLLSRIDEKTLVVTPEAPLAAVPEALAQGRFEGRASLRPDGRFALSYSPSRARAEDMLALIRAEGIGIRDLTTEQSDLEDIFLQLTADG